MLNLLNPTLLFLCSFLICSAELCAGAETPNVILIVADDLGYGDLSAFSETQIATPNLEQLADEGRKFTSFYVSQPVCTASRASLMSGCYANRVSLEGALNHTSRNGIHPDELLLPEVFQAHGYAVGAYGKWHLGTVSELLPGRHGFADWAGIPYSNDNSKFHPVLSQEMPPLPWYRNEEIVELDADQSQFTRRLTEHAVDFITQHKDRPFFLYVPQIMPHVPIFASEAFSGKSGLGLYADVIQELDWSVGQIMQSLRDLGLDERTLVIFTSDNGPFLSYGDHAGTAGVFRGGKLTAFEGGVRMPCIMRWTGRIPAGTTCDEVACSIDLLPTCQRLLGDPAPGRHIDGLDISKLLFDETAQSPHEAYAYYVGRELHAVRWGQYKLHVPHPYLDVWGEPGRDGKPSGWGETQAKSITQSGVEGIASRHGYRVHYFTEPQLYDLTHDPGESQNIAAELPDVVARLTAAADRFRADLGDALTKQTGSGVRPCGIIP